MIKTTITRFAPSPTGFLHIGGARTALFNWLYAKSKKGKFLLRIEDTDIFRSTSEATTAILKGLEWLDLDWDGEATSQRENIARHQEIADKLLQNDMAYHCYATQDEIAEFQSSAKQKGTSTIFQSPWRDETRVSHNQQKSVLRLRSSNDGTTQITDQIKGDISWKNSTLDDLVLLRADRTPTYMLAVVVDDHDMHVSHVIRGEDHLTNTARQIQIYNAIGWNVPEFGHMPLIHGADGTKLSKRHGAISVSEYEKMGYPSRAFNNYLARLGWSSGDVEHFTMEEAIQWFSLAKIGSSPARFDKKKLDSVSKHHIMDMDPKKLTQDLISFASHQKSKIINNEHTEILEQNIEILRERSKNYQEIIENAGFLLVSRPVDIKNQHQELLNNESLKMLERLTLKLSNVTWSTRDLEALLFSFVENERTKFKDVAQPLRVALIGQISSPNIAAVMKSLGREETLNRILDITVKNKE